MSFLHLRLKQSKKRGGTVKDTFSFFTKNSKFYGVCPVTPLGQVVSNLYTIRPRLCPFGGVEGQQITTISLIARNHL